MAGVAEHEDEPGLIRGQPLDDLLEGGGGDGGAVDPPDALRHIQLGWVVRVGVKPGGLAVDVAAQVQDALVFEHAQQPHTVPRGVGDQLGGGRCSPGVDELGDQIAAVRRIPGLDRCGELVNRGLVRFAVDQADEPVLHGVALGTPHIQAGGQPAGRLDPLDRRVRVVQAGHFGDFVQRVRLPPWRSGQPVGQLLAVREPAVHTPAIRFARAPAWFTLLVVVPGRGRKRRVHRPERVRCAHRPRAAGRVDPQVTRPTFLIGLVAAGIAGEPVPVDPDQLILVRHLRRACLRVDRRTARGRDRQPGGQPAGPAVVGMAVQQQVQVRAEDAVQVVGVAQVLVVGGGAPDRVVVHGTDPQPAVPLVTAQGLGDGTELVFPEAAVVHLVRFGHRRVQSSHDDFAVGDLDQRPFGADTEADRGVDTVEPPQQGVEAFPLRPVRRLGIPLEGLLTQEVGLAEQPVDVVVARDDHEPVPVEFQALRQCDEEVVHLVELALVAGLGQVTGDHDEVGPQALGFGAASQVVVQPGEQGRVAAVGLGESGPAEHVVGPELGVGDVQHRDGRLRGLVRPARGCPDRGCLDRGGDRTGSSGEIRLVGTTRRATVRAGELRGDGGLRPAFDGSGNSREQRVGGGRLVAADQVDVGG